MPVSDTEGKLVAVILAAGIGQRLGPLGKNQPKALLPFFGKSMLALSIEKLARIGIKHIVVNAHHLWWQIKEAIDQERKRHPKVSFEISLEKNTLLDTGGALAQIHQRVRAKRYLVVNGDIVTTLSFEHLLNQHQAHGYMATMALLAQASSQERPVWVEKTLIKGFGSDYTKEAGYQAQGFACVQVLDAAFVERIPTQRISVIQIYREAIQAGIPVGSFTKEALWWDLGSPLRYSQAHFELLRSGQERPQNFSSDLLALGFASFDQPDCFWTDSVYQGATIKAPVALAHQTPLAKDTVIGPFVVASSGVSFVDKGPVSYCIAVQTNHTLTKQLTLNSAQSNKIVYDSLILEI